jgi:hypothetical protein
MRCFAQPTGTGSWNLLNIKYSPSRNWSLFAEGQLRSLKFYDNFHYYEYKGGVDFKAGKSLKLSLGAGSYQTYREGGNFVVPKNNDEFRLWPQLVLFQSIGRFNIEQRYRTEMRFTSKGYRNRFRYRLGISLPFGRAEHEVRPFQVSISNELFFTDNEPYFERNRLLFALQYRVSESTSLQIAYLHQFDYKINDETGRAFLVAGLYLDIFRNRTSPPAGDLEIQNN